MSPPLTFILALMLAVVASRAAGGTTDLEPLEQGNTSFAMELYARLRPLETNIVVSPYSISSVMAMVYAGARGETARQIEYALHFPPPDTNFHRLFGRLDSSLTLPQAKGNVELEVANSVWPQTGSGLLPQFLHSLNTEYRANVTAADFIDPRNREQSLAAINNWVVAKTHGKIRKMVSPADIDQRTRLVVASAVYFKGLWATPFPESATRPGTFIISSNRNVTIPFMTLSGQSFDYFQNESMELLVLPYRRSKLEMVLLLPHAGGTRGDWLEDADGKKLSREQQTLEALQKGLTPANFRAWRTAAQNQQVEVTIPKFKMSSRLLLDSTLEAMGVSDAFDETRADFSGIDGQRHRLLLSKVLHQACLEVDEKGTEAAASPTIAFRTWALHPEFFADHPFLFLIRDRSTGTILFIGRIANPQATGFSE